MQLQGLGYRARVMLHYVVNKRCLISDPENAFQVFCVPSNASLGWAVSCKANRCLAAVPKGMYVIVSARLRRIGMVSVPEHVSFQQMSFNDFFGSDPVKYKALTSLFSYSDLIHLAGNSFHVSSCGHFVIATLLLPKLKNFGARASL